MRQERKRQALASEAYRLSMRRNEFEHDFVRIMEHEYRSIMKCRNRLINTNDATPFMRSIWLSSILLYMRQMRKTIQLVRENRELTEKYGDIAFKKTYCEGWKYRPTLAAALDATGIVVFMALQDETNK